MITLATIENIKQEMGGYSLGGYSRKSDTEYMWFYLSDHSYSVGNTT
jgi:hypothetical protein